MAEKTTEMQEYNSENNKNTKTDEKYAEKPNVTAGPKSTIDKGIKGSANPNRNTSTPVKQNTTTPLANGLNKKLEKMQSTIKDKNMKDAQMLAKKKSKLNELNIKAYDKIDTNVQGLKQAFTQQFDEKMGRLTYICKNIAKLEEEIELVKASMDILAKNYEGKDKKI